MRRPRTGDTDAMEIFDFIVIGAGPAGEAAAFEARSRGAERRGHRPALVRRQLPAHRLPAVEVAAPRRGRARREPRALLVAAGVGSPRLHGQPARRCASEPDDSSHVRAARGSRRGLLSRDGPDRRPRDASRSATTARSTRSAPRTSSIAIGSQSKVPPLPGLETDPDLDEPRGDARPGAAPGASSSSAAARPAASCRRSTPGSASRSRSSSRATG